MKIAKPKGTAQDYAFWAVLPMAQTSKVESRLIRILNKSQSRRTVTHRAFGLATALTFGTALFMATARIAGTVPPGAAPPLPDVKTLHYKTADLGPSWGAIASSRNYLNDNGEVLGVLGPESVTIGKPILGLTGVWDAKQHWTPLILGANEARIEPAAFNNRGQFIGQSMDRRSLCSWILGDRNSHAYFRDTAALRQFKSAGGEFDGIASINDSGEMLINADQKTSHGRAFILQNGHMTALKPQPGQKWSGVSAERLNASGWVAGCSGGHAALWKEGTPIDLGVLTGYDGSMATMAAWQQWQHGNRGQRVRRCGRRAISRI